jgi:hypothetical protein
MPDSVSQLVATRADMLAHVFLTRRKDVLVMGAEGDDFLNQIAFIQVGGAELPNVRCSFGVFTKGTDQPLPNEEVATRFANARIKAIRDVPSYFFPVLFLAFSMEDDQGYYAWLIAPAIQDGEGTPMLVRNQQVECRKINRQSLDKIVDAVRKWYSSLTSVIFYTE